LGWENCYRNVRTRFHTMLALMDPSPTPKNRRLMPEAFDAEVARRTAQRSTEEWVLQEERLSWFINRVLEASVKMLPREVRRSWKGSVAVDATVVPAFARPARREKRTKKGVTPKTERHSSDPDADWYHRDKRDHLDSDPDPKLSVWGYEATLAVSGTDDPTEPAAVPTLAVGMAPLHKPGQAPGRHAVAALRSAHERGHPAGFLAADRAYTQAKPEDFQLPARALGYELVLDYKVDQLGRQGNHEGMLQVDVAWSARRCPRP
jgi:hypothetical protein